MLINVLFEERGKINQISEESILIVTIEIICNTDSAYVQVKVGVIENVSDSRKKGRDAAKNAKDLSDKEEVMLRSEHLT